jgi:hypothetical protein
VPGVGKRTMSTPISAMIVGAATRPTPVISSSRSTAWAKRGERFVDLAFQFGDVGAGLIDAAQHRASRKA